MDVTARARLRSPADLAFAAVADLGTYPSWMGLVRTSVAAPGHPDDAGPAWNVEVGARLGPVWKTKRVRMVRTEQRPLRGVRFERAEHDGRAHSPWVLVAEVEAAGSGSEVEFHLHYGGPRLPPLVDRGLRAELGRSGPRLDAHVGAMPSPG